MTDFLIRRLVRDYERTDDPVVRGRYGRLAGGAGLVANLVLFVGKLLAGWFSGSLAVMADAFNNLSDAASSVVTLVGFKLSAAPPDEEHPFGHGRGEYLSALVLAMLILLAGFELGKSSIDKILHPEATVFSWVSLGILVTALAVKLWMALFFRSIGNRIHSETLRAAATDSRNDILCTSLVLVSMVVEGVSGWQIDGYIGVLVALFVLWSGISILKDSISPLLGAAPDPEMVQGIRDMVLAHDGIVGIHDLIIHNYGPGRVVVSLHAEVPADVDILVSHDLIDRIEKEIQEKYRAVTCIHMDPVDTADERITNLRVLTETVLGDIDRRLSLHDFRVVFGATHTNLIFDVVIPFHYENTAGLVPEIQRRLQVVDDRLFVAATLEHSFL